MIHRKASLVNDKVTAGLEYECQSYQLIKHHPLYPEVNYIMIIVTNEKSTLWHCWLDCAKPAQSSQQDHSGEGDHVNRGEGPQGPWTPM